MSTLDLEPIKERLAAATPGPWDFHIIPPEIGGMGTGADAEFIANAPEDIAALIAEVERLRGQVNAVRKTVRSPGITTVKGSPADRIMRILEVTE